MSDFEQASAVPPPPPSGGTPSADEKQWAMFAHLSALVGGLITAGWAGGIGCVIGPFIIWQIKKDSLPFAAEQAKEALNFNISLAIVMLVLFLLGILTIGIGFIVIGPLMGLIGLAALVLVIIAAIKSHDGVAYRYPFTLRLVK